MQYPKIASEVWVFPFISANLADVAATATPMKKNVPRSAHFARITRASDGAVTDLT